MSNNIALLDSNFARFLRRWAMAILPKMQQGIPQAGSADIIGHFSSLMGSFPLGKKEINVEIAITGYEVASRFLTQEAFPEKWSSIQKELQYLREHGDSLSNVVELQKEEIVKKINQLLESVNISYWAGIPQPYFEFLTELFQLTEKNVNNPTLVYQFLGNNLDKLNEQLVEFLPRWVAAILPT